MNILIIGAGMYVCGKNTDGFGTILPAIFELSRTQMIESIDVVATSASSVAKLSQKIKALNAKMGLDVPVQAFPNDSSQVKDYRGLITTQKYDAAIVAVPDDLHYAIALDLIQANLPVLVVKPFTPTLKAAQDLTQQATERRCYAVVEFHKRFDESNLILRDAFRNGQLGDLLYAWIGYSQRKMIPESVFRLWADRTNIFQYLAVHYVDLLHFITGAKAHKVSALGQKSYLMSKSIDTYDAIEAMIEWQLSNGQRFVSTHLSHWIDPNTSPAMSDQKIYLVGTKGRMECDQKDRGIRINLDGEPLTHINPYFSYFYGPEGESEFRGYGAESIQVFLKDVQALKHQPQLYDELQKKRPTFQQACVSVAVTEAVNQSLEHSGAWVTLSY